MKNGVLGNYDPLQSELAENPTLQEVRLTALPMSLSALAICRSLGSRNCPPPAKIGDEKRVLQD
jgi:hypothetical protein